MGAPKRTDERGRAASFGEIRVALVHDWLTGMRGGERVFEVFCELFPEAEIFTLFHFQGSVSKTIEKHPIHTSRLSRLPGAKRHYRSWLPLFPSAIESFRLHDFDLVLSSSHCVAKGVRAGGAPHLSYCHTPMRYVWDRFEDYFGRDRPIHQRLAAHACRGFLQRWDRHSNEDVDRFVANSRHVARRIAVFYGREADVVHPPVDVDRFRPADEIGDYYLIVSALVPYKRVELALRAFAGSGRRLVVVGHGPEAAALRRVAGNAPEIEWLGWQSDSEVAKLMSRARAVLLPGEEDFGIVPLEAMASGRPAIALGRGGALETVVDLRCPGKAMPTGVLFDEPTVESLEDAIATLERSLAEFDPVALRTHAESFSRPVFRSRVRELIASFLETAASETFPAPQPLPPAEPSGHNDALSR